MFYVILLMDVIGHKKQIAFLRSIIINEKIPHAFLFEGEESLGKKKVAFEFIKAIFCENQELSKKPCQVCQSCLLVETASHPDFIFIAPQKREIRIDQIRSLQGQLSLRPSLAKVKAVIINDAHYLNSQAQNCFLKTLEEPRGQAIFILISSLPNVLLGTIQSRCEILKFYPPRDREIKEPLKKAEAREILTKNLLDKLLFIKDFYSQAEAQDVILLLDAMIWHLRKALWQRAQGEIKASALLKTKKAIELTEEAKTLLQTTNVNPRLLLENLVLNF